MGGGFPRIIARLTWCLLAAVSTPSGGQSQAAVPVVTIEVTVLARDGRPVPGLTIADFEIKLDGRVEPVRDLTYLQVPGMAGAVGPSFDAVTPAVSSVYRLVIGAPPDTEPGREFALGASVRKPGVSVLTNARAVAATPGAPAAPATVPKPAPPKAVVSIDEQLKTAIATGRALRGLTIALRPSVGRAPDAGQVLIDVHAEVPPRAKGPLTAIFGVVDAAGSIRSGRRQIDAAAEGAPYQLSFSLPVAPGTYKLRFAVADATGAMGATESVVEARLRSMGPFLASDLRRFTTGAGSPPRPLTGEELPSGATGLSAVLELYPVAGAAVPADVLVKIDLLAAGDQTPVIERVVTAEPRDDMLVGEAEFPLERLPAGAYSLTATVLSGAAVLGTTSATFAKR
jgi:hypothetical protein